MSSAEIELKEESSVRCFGGQTKVFSHNSVTLKCDMKFAVIVPPQAESSKVPVIYWLSGLTCTEQNFITKAGAQRAAAEHGVMIVCPDTSPRGVKIEGDDESWDFGTGAGFYLTATADKWKENYNMFAYVTDELPQIVNQSFNVDPERASIFGHSMGGHGALICALKCPGLYRSVSAFAPICHPSDCPWGKKAFGGYLASEDEWKNWDATELVKGYDGPSLEILIDQGKDDKFLRDGQLLPEDFVAACRDSNMPVVLRMQEGYDHSYYFISTFVDDHIAHHARALKA